MNRLTLLCSLLALILPAAHAAAEVQAGSAAAAAPSAAEDGETDGGEAVLEPKYPVAIETDNEDIKTMLLQHLPLIKEQRLEALDREQIDFLVEEAPKNALDMMKTEGYFNAKVEIVPRGQGFLVKVNPGPRTHIDNVSLVLLGDMVQDERLGDYYKTSFATWALPVGAPFRQADWTASKTSVLSAVTRRKYPLAEFTQTQATINPQNQKAELSVNVDSKRPIYFGGIDISGTERYPVKVARGLAQFNPGDVYDLDKILDYQQALEQDNHYSGASVQADFDHLDGDRVPVKVSVSEVRRQKFEAGIRFDSEYGLGGNLGYDHYNVLNRGYVGSIHLDADKYQRTLAVGISQPRNSRGYYNTANVAYNSSTTQKLETHAVSSGFWRVRDRDGIEARYGIEFVSESAGIPDRNVRLGRSHATMITAAWKRQNISTTLRPANGYYLDGKIGTTLGSFLSSATMARVKSSAGYYFTPEDNKKIGTFVARGEIGYVYTRAAEAVGDVPSSLMFRTGGANSIRGYELNSIGRRLNDGTVLPDRAMVVLSGEYQFPIKKDFALALFHDAGGTAGNFKDMTLRHGTGSGVRWFSPVAPLSFDIAYGHHDKRLRWHINIGTRF